MKTKWLFLALILIPLSSTSLFAQAESDTYKAALADYKKSENELNTTYKRILRMYAGDTVFIKKVKESQRLWTLLKEADIEMIYPDHKKKKDEYGPTLPSCKLWEMKDMVDERNDFLNQWVEGIDEGTECAGSRKVGGGE